MILEILKKIKIEYVLILLVFFYLNGKQDQTKNDLLQFTNSLQDSITVKMDKYGDRVSEISQIRTSDPKVFLNLNTNNPEIQKLQEEVKKYKNQLDNGGSVTVFTSSVKVDTTLVVEQKEDGIVTSATDGEWYSVKNYIVGDQGRTSLAIKNDYTIAVVEEDGKSVVKIKNKNPYATEGEIRTYANLPKQDKKISIGVGIGYDPFNGTMKPELQLHYKILSIK
jgi:hypothetical protein